MELELPPRTNSSGRAARSTQADIIEAYLLTGRTLTDGECRQLFGYTRLADIIFKLRARLGETAIETKTEKAVTRTGTPAYIGRYSMAPEIRLQLLRDAAWGGDTARWLK
jgi:hypothetical protein